VIPMSTQPPQDPLDTKDARTRILSRIRAAQGRPDQAKDREEELNYNYVAQKPSGPKPAVGDDLLARFIEQSERLQSTVARLSSLEEIPSAVAEYLQARGLGQRAVIWPTFAQLDWNGAGLTVEARAPVRDEPTPDMVGITGCFAAIAETGTLALLSGADSPASMALLPETHVAVVPKSRIVAHMEDVFALLRHERGAPPRALNFVSGPSRTGDIEQTIVLGAHGPYRVHLLILEGL
jgi:L-lactate dehydrogenase complex protein LldG